MCIYHLHMVTFKYLVDYGLMCKNTPQIGHICIELGLDGHLIRLRGRFPVVIQKCVQNNGAPSQMSHTCCALSLFPSPLFLADLWDYISIAMPKIDPRNAPGAVVHAPAHKVLGKRTAKAHLGNPNYCLTILQGAIVRASSDGKEGAQSARSGGSMSTSPILIRKEPRLSWRRLTSSGCTASSGRFRPERIQLTFPSQTPSMSSTILWEAVDITATAAATALFPALRILSARQEEIALDYQDHCHG